MWPFRRRARGAEEVSPQDAGPVLRAPRQDWKALGPMPTVQSRPLATVDVGFEQRLATRQAPTFVGPLGHHLAPEAPHGRVAAAPASPVQRQALTFPPAPHGPRQAMTFAQPPPTPDLPPAEVAMDPADPAVPIAAADVDAAPPAPATGDVPVVVRAAPVVSRLVTASQPREFPTVPFPVVAQRAVDEAMPVPAGEPAVTPPDGAGAAEEAAADAVASLVGDKPPITSVPDAGGSAPSPTPDPAPGPTSDHVPPSAPRPVQRSQSTAAHPLPRTTASPGSPARAEPLAKRQEGMPQPPTVARTLDQTGRPRPRVTPRIGPPIQRTAEGTMLGHAATPVPSPSTPAAEVPSPAAPESVTTPTAPEVVADAASEPAPERRTPDPSTPDRPSPVAVYTAEPWVEVGAGLESRALIGDRGLSGAPTSSPAPASSSVPGSPTPTVARAPLPGGGPSTPAAGGPAVTAQRAMTWRPRVGEPFAPVQLGSTPSSAPPSVAGRPTVSRHAAGGPGHEHAADERAEVSTLAVSRLAESPARRVPASPSVARAPEPDARTATRQETTVGGIRWSDRPAPVASPWSTAAVQRATTTTTATTSAPLPRARSGAPSSRTPTGSTPQLSMPNDGRSPSRVEEQIWWELPGVADVVQRQADTETAPEPAPTEVPPEANTVTATAETGPAAPAGAAAAGGARKAPTEAEADEWARALYPALRRRICRDLLLDRERSGYSTDIRF